MHDLKTWTEPITGAKAVPATFVAILASILGCALYAAWNDRGLYLDGVWLLYQIANHDWFYLPAPARTTIDLLRQAPTVALTRYTDLSFVHRGQVLSFTMAALPALLIAACWLIVPRERK